MGILQAGVLDKAQILRTYWENKIFFENIISTWSEIVGIHVLINFINIKSNLTYVLVKLVALGSQTDTTAM